MNQSMMADSRAGGQRLYHPHPVMRGALVFLVSVTSLVWSADKDTKVSSFLSVVQQLQVLARETRVGDPDAKVRAAIETLLPETLSSDQLFRLGVSAHLIAYPQEAGSDTPFDGVFAYASRRCAVLLSTRNDLESADLLRRMQPICGSDGGEHLMYEKLIERQEKGSKKTEERKRDE